MPKPINDIVIANWRDYPDIITDSLWLINKRDNSGEHSASMHGAFIPQIPNQMIRRYTRVGDTVLDLFCGSGVTAIEAAKLGRNSINLDLSPEMIETAMDRVEKTESNTSHTFHLCDSTNRGQSHTEIQSGITAINKPGATMFLDQCDNNFKRKVQLVMLHPPYFNIVKFSEHQDDLSNYSSLDTFLMAMERVAEVTRDALEPSRFAALVIGDYYADSQWVPLGFYCMQKFLDAGFRLKSTIVKNMTGNRAKRNAERLWIRRSLVGGFFVFRHEYIFVLQAPKERKTRTRKT